MGIVHSKRIVDLEGITPELRKPYTRGTPFFYEALRRTGYFFLHLFERQPGASLPARQVLQDKGQFWMCDNFLSSLIGKQIEKEIDLPA